MNWGFGRPGRFGCDQVPRWFFLCGLRLALLCAVLRVNAVVLGFQEFVKFPHEIIEGRWILFLLDTEAQPIHSFSFFWGH